MQLYRKEFKRLKKAQSIIDTRFSRLGINKKQEITRLLYEISKRENLPPEKIAVNLPEDFNKIKKTLLKRRLPYAHLHNEISRPYLPKMGMDYPSILNPRKTVYYPKKIFIEKAARHSSLTQRFKKNFPEAVFKEIKSLKDYLKRHRNLTVADYNNRRATGFITYENHDFFKKCPCTKKAIRCGYYIFNLSFGCIYECSYCYLQEYTNNPGIIFPANLDRFFKAFGSYKRPGMRIGTGEFSDSLMIDHVTEYSLPIVKFFKKHKDVKFEFKTKSENIGNLLNANQSGNIVVSWSLNPQKIIDKDEFFAAPLEKRISSARRCIKAGYTVGFHFDPVMYFKGWQKEYEKVIDMLFAAIRPKYISWISIGTLRFNPRVKQIIERRFPDNKILDEELVLGFDNKLRYPYSLRYNMYKEILAMIFKHSRKIPVYLCMESHTMWRALNIPPVNFKK